MNNKPVRRMEGVLLGICWALLYSQGHRKNWAEGHGEEWKQCASTVCVLFTVTEGLLLMLLQAALSSPTGDPHPHSKSIQG